MDGLPFSETWKPKRGGLVETRSQVRRGEHLGEV
jgi:hypothetical protein